MEAMRSPYQSHLQDYSGCSGEGEASALSWVVLGNFPVALDTMPRTVRLGLLTALMRRVVR